MWVVRLTDKQLEVLRALLRSEEHLGPALKGSIEALDLARWDDLPEAELPWDQIESLARRQSISEADVIWDIPASKTRRPTRERQAFSIEVGATAAWRVRLPVSSAIFAAEVLARDGALWRDPIRQSK